MGFISTFVKGIFKETLILVPLVAAIVGYAVGLWTACDLTVADVGQLGGFFTTVATVLGALVVGLIFSSIFGDPADRFTPALRLIALYLGVGLVACCAGLVPGRNPEFVKQCFSISTAAGGASVIGLLLLVVRSRGGSAVDRWVEAVRLAMPEQDDEDS